MKNGGKTVLSVAFLSLFARLLTLFSQQVYISHFGDTRSMNIFSYALNMPNTIFNCIGTALSLVVIPVYTSLLAKDDKKSADRFLDNIITVSACLILALIGAAIAVAPAIGKMTGYAENPEDLSFLVFSLRLMMPVMLFYGLNYIFQGVSQANGMFRLPSVVTVPASLITILYTVFLGGSFGVRGLLFASFFGLCLQPIVLLPAVKKAGYKYKPSFDLKDKHLRGAAKSTLPVLISASAYQINTVFNTTMATRYGTVMLMVFSQQIVVISVLTIIYSITGVYFPRLTSQWAVEDKEGFKDVLSFMVGVAIFLLIPAGAGFFILRVDIMDLLINYKNMSPDSVSAAADMLGIYGAGVLFVALKEILDRAFYSQKDSRTPAVFGFVIMGANIIITYMLMPRFGPYSMPISYGLSAFLGTGGLALRQNKRVGFLNRDLLVLTVKCLVCAAIMGVFVKLAAVFMGGMGQSGILFRAAKLIVPVLAGASVYFLSAYLLRIKELRDMVNNLTKKVGK